MRHRYDIITSNNTLIICYKSTFSYVLQIARFPNMADDGEEFVVDKILDKRVRNGKVNCCLWTPPLSRIPGGVLPLLEGLWSRGEHMGAARKP